MAQISNYGELKTEISRILFHTRLVGDYPAATVNFERAASRRLRLRQMETSADLTTTLGAVAIPADYLVWRTVLWTGATPYVEIEYVHPAYLNEISTGSPRIFTIEGSTFHARPIDDVNAYEFHYYQNIPTITDNDANSNWLLLAHPDVYLFGTLLELFSINRNLEAAQLYKARRDELFAEIIQLSALTTGATSPAVRTSEYF